MKKIIYLILLLFASYNTQSQTPASSTQEEREYINELAMGVLKHEDLVLAGSDFVPMDSLWQKYYIKTLSKSIEHPFLRDDLRYILLWQIDTSSVGLGFPNDNLKNIFIKSWVDRIYNQPVIQLLQNGQIRYDLVQTEHYFRTVTSYKDSIYVETIYKTGDAIEFVEKHKPAIAYLYKLLDNEEILYMGEARSGYIHKMYKKEIGAYIISRCLASEGEAIYIPYEYRVNTIDRVDEKIPIKTSKAIDKRIKAFKEMLHKKYPHYLKAPPIKYSETIKWYKDKYGNPTKDASKIVEKAD